MLFTDIILTYNIQQSVLPTSTNPWLSNLLSDTNTQGRTEREKL